MDIISMLEIYFKKSSDLSPPPPSFFFSLCLIIVTSSYLTRKSIIRACRDSKKESFAQQVEVKTYWLLTLCCL